MLNLANSELITCQHLTLHFRQHGSVIWGAWLDLQKK
uniref:Uncharacterized protein n=1 Tax=Arundo donax TaxID=35708 RepID=A0A0A9FI31_ARUDO